MRGKIRERILRVLLNNPSGDVSRYRVAKQVGCSYPWVREFLLKLEDIELVKGTKVIDYPGLFQYWKSVSLKNKHKTYMIKRPLKVLKDASLLYALTTYQAETLIQNYLFPSRIDIYVKEENWEEWHKLLSEKGLVGGGNLRLLLSDDHVFYRSFEKKGLRIVSIPQLIVDLLKEGGVCIEAAEMLIERMERDVRTL
jgi:DNA-binding Lrp family transcriptional regulator